MRATSRKHWNSPRFQPGDRVKFYMYPESWIGYVSYQSMHEVRAYFPMLGERHFTWRGHAGIFILRGMSRGLLTPTTEKNMYTQTNFKSKKALKEAHASGEKITVFYPGIQGSTRTGKVCLEGPHYPQAHSWYAEVEIRDMVIVPGSKIK